MHPRDLSDRRVCRPHGYEEPVLRFASGAEYLLRYSGHPKGQPCHHHSRRIGADCVAGSGLNATGGKTGLGRARLVSVPKRSAKGLAKDAGAVSIGYRRCVLGQPASAMLTTQGKMSRFLPVQISAACCRRLCPFILVVRAGNRSGPAALN